MRVHAAVAVVTLVATVMKSSLLGAQIPDTAIARADTSVPADLRVLLAPHHSDMRLVMLRYAADRALLASNYAGPVRGRGGRGSPRADSTAPAPLPLSLHRLARLKRFDLSWQSALRGLDATTLSPDARADLDSLERTIATNLAAIENDAQTLVQFSPVLAFAPDLVDLIEKRLQLHDVDPEAAAGVLSHTMTEIASLRTALDAGLGDSAATNLHLDRADAVRIAATVDLVRNNLASWFAFYDGFDPLFTWWIDLPHRRLNAALIGYASFLRDTLAPATTVAESRLPVTATIPAAGGIEPAAAAPYDEVPDLREIIALRQDEMTPVVNRFLGRDETRRLAGNGPDNAPATHDSAYYQHWLTALQTVDFDHLSRNAQVDYLYVRRVSELQLARIGHPVPTNPPRVADSSGLPGVARGREGLIRDLQDQLIPYTPEQLIGLAEREFAWCDREIRAASRQMGFGDDWKAALEKTKTMHVAPGEQPAMIRDLVFSAIDYVRAHDLVTVPEVVAESQHMSMLSPRQQLVNPFFLGGAQIQVAFPTDSMEYDAREQSMRGNNIPWSHATAFHEMVPGHNLSQYYNARYATYRADLGAGGPFYVEGWAVYWEITLYDKGWDATPPEKIGALFWRMFRCARIIFSLKFHMGQWSPQQAVNFLVDSVGHERDNATAEVRRSFQGDYPPLYQAGYLLGALELRALRHEFVDSGQLTEKQFHDEILRQGSMPIALLRLALTRQPLTRGMDITWKFAGDLLPDTAVAGSGAGGYR